MARWTLEKLETASRKQLKTYIESLGKETYPEESTAELRDSAIHYFEQTLPEEDSGLSVRSASAAVNLSRACRRSVSNHIIHRTTPQLCTSIGLSVAQLSSG